MARGINKVILVQEYAAGHSIPEVASRNGVSRSTVRNAVIAAGITRTRADAIRSAAQKGKLGGGLRGKKRVFSNTHKAAIAEAAKARGARFATGFSVKPNGYAEITTGLNKGRLVHRVIAETLIGRKLCPDEVVHHRDHDKLNNSAENLHVMTRAAHTSLHRKESR